MDVLNRTAELLAALRGSTKENRHEAQAEWADFRSIAVAGLVEALADVSPERRWLAAELLGSAGDVSCRLHLEEALDDSHYRVRRGAAQSLGELGDPAAVTALVKHMNEPHAVARRAVVEALGKLADPSVQSTLCAALRDPQSRVRGAAAVALGRIGGAESVRPLVDALRDADPLVCRWAARALGQFAQREPRVALRVAIPELKRRTAWWSLESKEAYRRAIRRIEEATAGRESLPLSAQSPSIQMDSFPVPAQSENNHRRPVS